MQTLREWVMSKTSDPLTECNNHILNIVKRLPKLAITATIFVLLGCPHLPAPHIEFCVPFFPKNEDNFKM